MRHADPREPVRVRPYVPAPESGRGARLRLVRAGSSPLRLVPPGGRAPEADLRGVAEATVRLVIEVLAGTRAPHHLSSRAVPQVCAALTAHRLPVATGARIAPPQVLTTWVQEPAPGAAEAGAVVLLAGRVQAMALRLEHHRGRWRCTAIETTTPTPARQQARRTG